MTDLHIDFACKVSCMRLWPAREGLTLRQTADSQEKI